MRKVVFTIEQLVVKHMVFDRNTEEEKHLKLSGYLNQFQDIIAILKALQGLTSTCFTPWTPAAKDNSVTQNVWFLYSQTLFFPDIVPDTLNRALTK